MEEAKGSGQLLDYCIRITKSMKNHSQGNIKNEIYISFRSSNKSKSNCIVLLQRKEKCPPAKFQHFALLQSIFMLNFLWSLRNATYHEYILSCYFFQSRQTSIKYIFSTNPTNIFSAKLCI